MQVIDRGGVGGGFQGGTRAYVSEGGGVGGDVNVVGCALVGRRRIHGVFV